MKTMKTLGLAPLLDAKYAEGQNQSCRFPDMLTRIGEHKVRLRFEIDSYLGQSIARSEVWTDTGWTEVWSIHLGVEYETSLGAMDHKTILDPNSSVLASPYVKDATLKVQSWQKVINKLHDQTYSILVG